MRSIVVAGKFRSQGRVFPDPCYCGHCMVPQPLDPSLHRFPARRTFSALLPYLLDPISLSVPVVHSSSGNLFGSGMESISRVNPDGRRKRGIVGRERTYK